MKKKLPLNIPKLKSEEEETENEFGGVIYAANGMLVRYIPPEASVNEQHERLTIETGKLELIIDDKAVTLSMSDALHLSFIIKKIVMEDYENARMLQDIGKRIVKGLDERTGYA